MKKFGSFAGTLTLLALATVVAAGCSGVDDCALTDTCETTCDPAAETDSCLTAKPGTACHPDTLLCATVCNADTECTTAGQKCDQATKVCRDESKITPPDCTVAGNECATTKVCDAAATKACVDPCTNEGFVCATGTVCHTGTKLCVADCTAEGATCAEGQRCDTTAKVCVAKCGDTTCAAYEFCGTDGACAKNCDADADPTLCGTDTVCDGKKAGGSGKCLAACYLEAGATVCDATHFCQDEEGAPKYGACVPKCLTNNDCAAGAGFCILASGKCEDQRAWDDCKPTSATAFTSLDPVTNTCAAIPAAAGADAAKRDANTAASVEGPTAYAATFVSYESASDGHCTGLRAKFTVAFHDYEGDFATSNTGSALYLALRIAIGTADEDDDAYSNTTPTVAGTATDGVLSFTICRAAATTEKTFTVFLRDAASGTKHFGNSVDVTAPVPPA